MTLLQAAEKLKKLYPESKHWRADKAVSIGESGHVSYTISIQPGLGCECSLTTGSTLEEALGKAAIEWREPSTHDQNEE